MAKSKKTDLYEAKPKPDVYMVLLIITFLGMTAATALMYVEYNSLSP